MDDRYEGGAGGQEQGIWPLYVGLFLVLLSFFIMLAGLSKDDAGRTSAVVESPRPTFRPQPAGRQSDEPVYSESDTALDRLGGELAGLLRIPLVERLGRGQELRVTFPASELFPANSAELRDESTPLIDRVVAAFGASPPGNRLEVAFSLGRPDGGDASNELALAVRRNGAFADAVVARGAPPGAVAIGIDANASGRASLAFRYVSFESAESGPAR
jgi:hypothetical protein